jgi:hypothetical protein
MPHKFRLVHHRRHDILRTPYALIKRPSANPGLGLTLDDNSPRRRRQRAFSHGCECSIPAKIELPPACACACACACARSKNASERMRQPMGSGPGRDPIRGSLHQVMRLSCVRRVVTDLRRPGDCRGAVSKYRIYLLLRYRSYLSS